MGMIGLHSRVGLGALKQPDSRRAKHLCNSDLAPSVEGYSEDAWKNARLRLLDFGELCRMHALKVNTVHCNALSCLLHCRDS